MIPPWTVAWNIVGMITRTKQGYPPVIKHGLLENGPFIGDFPMKTSIHKVFSITMFDYQSIPKTCNFPESLDVLGFPSLSWLRFWGSGAPSWSASFQLPPRDFPAPRVHWSPEKKNMREEKVVLRNGLWPKNEVLCRKFIFQTHFFGLHVRFQRGQSLECSINSIEICLNCNTSTEH